jgi:hypothetical protein
MKIYGLILSICFTLLLSGCRDTSEICAILSQRLENEFARGNFSVLKTITDSLRVVCDDKTALGKSDSLCRTADRISLDFPYNEQDIAEKLKQVTGEYTETEKDGWEKRNWLESRIINGEKRYFTRAVSNLSLIKSFHLDRPARDSSLAHEPEIIFRKGHTSEIISRSSESDRPVVPVNMTVSYTLTLDADAVPEGETVRCWLPFPREDQPRQKDIRLLSASDKDFLISPDSSIHRTIYMESEAVRGKPVIFNIRYSYTSAGQYFTPETLKEPHDLNSSEINRLYTSEQPPQIRFSEPVRKLADSIAADETDPYLIVRKIYYWFNDNIPWAGALEYSIMPDIPGYVITNRRGDCGMQTFLLMSMLRYKGIPVRWQSGWMVPPDAENLHDWCEVYYQGAGWVPVDISYGLQYSDNKKTREFYISGIDSYRLIVNDGIAGRLYPEKKHPRSEPFDFQRGEVEWNEGNLYFDKWDYNIEITYNK